MSLETEAIHPLPALDGDWPASGAPNDPLPLRRAAWTYKVEPLFLVGCPRSGTTWLQAMLAGHPGIHSGPETHFFHCFRSITRDYARSEGKWFGFSRYLDRRQFSAYLREAFWLLVSGRPGPETPPRYFLEKTPDHCLDGDAILSAFPRARFIHLARDARSVTASLLRGSRGWASDWAPRTTLDAAFMWAERISAAQEIGRRVGPEACCELRYEDLRAEPERHLARLFQWLDLPAAPGLVEQLVEENRLDRAIAQGSHFRAIPGFANLPQGFVGRAPASGAEAGLTGEQRALVEQAVGPELRRLGYPVEIQPLVLRAAETPSDSPFRKSVLVLGDGDDPGEIMDTLGAMAADWQEDWELVLSSTGGQAAGAAAQCLEGDYQLLEPEEPISYGEAITRAAVAARARDLVIPTARGLFTLSRRELLDLGGVPSASRAEAVAWVAWRGRECPELLPGCRPS